MFQTVLNTLQNISSYFGVVFGIVYGITLFFPKIGEILLNRIITSSIEKQRASYARELETHKLALTVQLEEHKKNLAIQLEEAKQQLSLRSAEERRQIDARQTIINELRMKASNLYAESETESDTNLKYRKTAIFLRHVSTYPKSVKKEFHSELEILNDFIEGPLSLENRNFCDDVDSLLLNLINKIDDMSCT